MKKYNILNPFLKKRVIELSNGNTVSVPQFIEEIVLPKFKDAEVVKLNNGKKVSLNTFINQYVLTYCLNEYNCDFNKFYSDYVDDNINRFFSENNINIDSISKLSESYVYNMNDINPIITKYAIYNDPVYSKMSVADIIGAVSESDDYDKNNIVNNLDLYFSRNDQRIVSYNNRSNGMLNYSKHNIVSGLYNSLRKEPIVVVKLDDGRALISTNGMHRYHLLRICYLDELSKTTNEQERQELNNKYTIPVKVETVDLIKTYSNYLLRLTGANFMLYMERNDKYEQTGNSILALGDGQHVLNDQQLLGVVKANLDRININSPMFQKCYEKIPSFNKYINLYFPEMLSTQEERRGIRN